MRFVQVILQVSNMYPELLTFAHRTLKCVGFCKVISLSSGDDINLDCIPGRPVTSELVAKTESSPQQPGFLKPAPRNDAGNTIIFFYEVAAKPCYCSMAEVPPREGGTQQDGEEAVGRD